MHLGDFKTFRRIVFLPLKVDKSELGFETADINLWRHHLFMNGSLLGAKRAACVLPPLTLAKPTALKKNPHLSPHTLPLC